MTGKPEIAYRVYPSETLSCSAASLCKDLTDRFEYLGTQAFTLNDGMDVLVIWTGKSVIRGLNKDNLEDLEKSDVIAKYILQFLVEDETNPLPTHIVGIDRIGDIPRIGGLNPLYLPNLKYAGSIYVPYKEAHGKFIKTGYANEMCSSKPRSFIKHGAILWG
jgi:hypothetical protein